ncbi:hypothetical protein GGP41_009196 [Bipolaris sorokiniana]|uniref:Uncharacterized protein n=2 Tax=Cochliobolus sativus TaxID=45130 RepID=A0A8H6DVF2_COCSA|nr:uncharacterized protein COCSADRAFT_41193 [Bipolaris sorokiniana ND90Pr]EMD59327.1 hypothetical protein COCSADRAFT_41193 [Bipolaris sorokiniana ND90Pr]KAF5847920.1 hypothetical protein GGP41_009196 [Bipolaris sorokiniana]
METPDSTYSGFLSLSTEIRCQIYDYLLAESYAITISAGYTTSDGIPVQDCARKTEIPGLPLHLAPIARRGHVASLLSVVMPPTIALEDGQTDDVESENLGLSAPLALSLTSRLVKDELRDCIRRRKHMLDARAVYDDDGVLQDDEENVEGISLHVSYPYGVLVLKSQYPYLLKQARRVYVSGYYTPLLEEEPTVPDPSDSEHLTPSNSLAAPSFNTPASGPSTSFVVAPSNSSRRPPRHGANRSPSRPRLRMGAPLSRQSCHASHITTAFPAFSKSTATHAPAALAHLVSTIMPKTLGSLTKFTARILFPGENTYGSVWGDDNSPVTHILRSICGGKIDMKVLRCNLGTGLKLTARPKPWSRIVSTSWVNWKKGDFMVEGSPNAARRASGSLSVSDLDQFLRGVQCGA